MRRPNQLGTVLSVFTTSTGSHRPTFRQILNTTFCSAPLLLALATLTPHFPLVYPPLEMQTGRSGPSPGPSGAVRFPGTEPTLGVRLLTPVDYLQ